MLVLYKSLINYKITYSRGKFAVPIMDIVVFFILFNDHIGVAIVKLPKELRVLSDRLELLDSVDLNVVLASLCEKGLSLSL